jgi:hypothetical protein
MPNSLKINYKTSQSNEQTTDIVWQWVDYELSQGRSVSLKVTGQSMSPLLLSGSYITLTPFYGNQDSLAIGDIIYLPQLRVIHRLMMKYSKFIWSKGDRLAYFDNKQLLIHVKAMVTSIDTPPEYSSNIRLHINQYFSNFYWRIIAILFSTTYLFYARFKIYCISLYRYIKEYVSS